MWQYTLNHSQQRARHWLEAMVVVVGLAVLEWVGVTQPVTAVVEQLARPFLLASLQVIKVSEQPYQLVVANQRAFRRIQDLEQRYAETLAQVGELQALRAENKALRELLAQPESQSQKMVVSAPIVSLATPAIAGGELEGIAVGQLVTVSGTMVGTVTATTPHQSEVTLLNSRRHVPLLVQTESGVQGLIVGDGRNVLLTELPREAEIEVGELVTTWGQPGVAKDIIIGRVRAIKNDVSAPVQTAVIDQLVSFYQASLVEVR